MPALMILFFLASVVQAQNVCDYPTMQFGQGALDVASSRDGTRLAAGMSNGMQIWDLNNFSAPVKSVTVDKPIHAVVWDPSDRMVATGFENSSYFTVWNTDSLTVWREFSGVSSQRQIFAWSPDSKYIACIGASGKHVLIYETSSGNISQSFANDEYVWSLSWSGNGTLAAGLDRSLRMWYWTSSKLLNVTGVDMYFTARPIMYVAWSPDSQVVAFCSDGGVAVHGQSYQNWVARACASDIPKLEWAVDGIHLAILTPEGRVTVARALEGFYRDLPISCVAFTWSTDNQLVYSSGTLLLHMDAGVERPPIMLNLPSISQLPSFPYPNNIIRSPTGKQLALARGSTIVVLDATNSSFRQFDSVLAIKELNWKSDRELVSIHFGVLKFWDVESGTLLDSRMIASTDTECSFHGDKVAELVAYAHLSLSAIIIRNASDYSLLMTLNVTEGLAKSARWSFEGRFLVVGVNGSLVVLDTEVGRRYARSLPYEDYTWNPSAALLAVTNSSCLWIWDVLADFVLTVRLNQPRLPTWLNRNMVVALSGSTLYIIDIVSAITSVIVSAPPYPISGLAIATSSVNSFQIATSLISNGWRLSMRELSWPISLSVDVSPTGSTTYKLQYFGTPWRSSWLHLISTSQTCFVIRLRGDSGMLLRTGFGSFRIRVRNQNYDDSWIELGVFPIFCPFGTQTSSNQIECEPCPDTTYRSSNQTGLPCQYCAGYVNSAKTVCFACPANSLPDYTQASCTCAFQFRADNTNGQLQCWQCGLGQMCSGQEDLPVWMQVVFYTFSCIDCVCLLAFVGLRLVRGKNSMTTAFYMHMFNWIIIKVVTLVMCFIVKDQLHFLILYTSSAELLHATSRVALYSAWTTLGYSSTKRSRTVWACMALGLGLAVAIFLVVLELIVAADVPWALVGISSLLLSFLICFIGRFFRPFPLRDGLICGIFGFMGLLYFVIVLANFTEEFVLVLLCVDVLFTLLICHFAKRMHQQRSEVEQSDVAMGYIALEDRKGKLDWLPAQVTYIPPHLLRGEVPLAGGTATVVKAKWDVAKSKSLDVAVKLFYRSQKSTYVREINVLQLARHDNLVKLHGVSESADVVKLVLEYFPRTLEEVDVQTISISEILKVFAGCFAGLSFLHKLDIVHRDLKPANILLDDNFTAKICDFGISKDNMAAQTTTAGTLAFMAPEVRRGERPTPAQDVYSLGLCLRQFLERKQVTALWKLTDGHGRVSAMIIEDSVHDVLWIQLVELCNTCTSFEPEHRVSSERAAAILAQLLLQGSRLYQKAIDAREMFRQEDTSAYSKAWATCVQKDRKLAQRLEHLVSRLASHFAGVTLKHSAVFSYEDLEQLADRHAAGFHLSVALFITEYGGVYQRGPRKKKEDCIRKVKDDYKGDFGRLIDFERGTGVFPDLQTIYNALSALSRATPVPSFSLNEDLPVDGDLQSLLLKRLKDRIFKTVLHRVPRPIAKR